MNILYLKNVKKDLIDFELDINLEVKKGEILAILGKSGSGKSSILKIIQGLLNFDSGMIEKDDNLTIATIFQDFNLLYNKSVYENIYLPLKLKGIKDDKLVNDIIRFVYLDEYKDKYIYNLSGGQKQRVAIARALVQKPDLLLCDEFSSSLDDEVKIEILDLFEKINKDYNLSIILVTHELNVVKHIANRVAIIEKGKIVDEFNINNKKMLNITNEYINYVKEFLK